jgi:microcompartment protein CcmL/EutN
MTRHAIPAEDKRLAFEINTESGRVLLAMSGDTATIAAIERGQQAASRLRRLAASMETALRRQLATARQAEREATREAEKAERRNDAIRRERGLPSGSADLAIPNF